MATLLRYALVETTAGYARLADAHLVEAAEKVGAAIAAAINYPLAGRATPSPWRL